VVCCWRCAKKKSVCHLLYLSQNNIYSKTCSKWNRNRQSVGQFILASCPFWSRWPDVTFLWVTIFLFFHVGRPLWREDGPVICSAMTQVQFQVILRPMVCQPVRLGDGAHDRILISLFDNYFLLGVGLSHPYPPWTGWCSPKSKSKVKVMLV
jgi:hypothetical protein